MLYPQNKVNKFIKKGKIWGIQKNIEEEEKWDQKKEELEKEIKENKIYSFKWNLANISIKLEYMLSFHSCCH